MEHISVSKGSPKRSPKKSLGQHFLKSETALMKIRDAADMHADDVILEIGPGTGALTKVLLASAGTVIAVEKDRELITGLQTQFAPEITSGAFELIEGDILAFDFEAFQKKLQSRGDHTYKVVANIPYYITGAIIEEFLSASFQPEHMVLLIQKEVADRIVAKGKNGETTDGKESVLSIAVKVYGKPRILAKVPAGAFNPPPKVDSAIISIEHISRDFFTGTDGAGACDEGTFFKLLKFVFGKKRGQLGGRLAHYIEDRSQAAAILSKLGLDPKLRPENLSPHDWKRLAQLLY